MRVRSLQTYLLNQRLVQSGSLEQLRGKRIGVDAVFWLRTLANLKDPLADAVGGLPPSVFGVLDKSISTLERLGISMLFVFQGMQPRSHMLFSSQLHHQMDDAWRQAIKGDFMEAQHRFASATSRINSDFVFVVSRYLQAKGCETFQAPYFAASQLAYFVQEGVVDAVVGPPALLLFGIPRVITGINPQEDRFEWVELEQLLGTWNITEEQFVDACLLAGTEYCLTFPYLNLSQFHGGGHRFHFGTAVDFIKQAPLIGYMQHFPNEEMRLDHVDGYCVCKTLIKYPLALHFDGRLRPVVRKDKLQGNAQGQELEEVPVPEDFYKIVGLTLPNSVLVLMGRHILSRKLPSVLALGEWWDSSHPTVDSVEYRDLLKEVRDYRRRAVGLIASRLHETFRTRSIRFARYTCHSATGPAPVVEALPNCRPGMPWSFTAAQLMEEMARQEVTRPSFRFCLNWHAYETAHGRNLLAGPGRNGQLPDGPVTDIRNLQVFQTTVYFMLLENMGFFTPEGGATVFGSALGSTSPEFEEDTLLALELMKCGDLMGEPLEAPYDRPFPEEISWLRVPSNAPHQRSILLLGRLVSLTPMSLSDSELWLAPVDFDLAAFHSIVKILKRTFRLLTEACMSNLLLKDMSVLKLIPTDELSPKDPRLPLFMLPRNCMGIIFKHFLEFETEPQIEAAQVNEGTSVAASQRKWKRLEAELTATFPCCKCPMADLFKALRFWLEVRRIIQWLSRNIDVGIFKSDMEEAHRYLVQRIYQVGLYHHVLFQTEAFSSLRAEVAKLMPRDNASRTTTVPVSGAPSPTPELTTSDARNGTKARPEETPA